MYLVQGTRYDVQGTYTWYITLTSKGHYGVLRTLELSLHHLVWMYDVHMYYYGVITELRSTMYLYIVAATSYVYDVQVHRTRYIVAPSRGSH